MRQVYISLGAQEAFASAYDWLTQDGAGAAAWARWVALRDSPDALAEFPYRGPRSGEHPGYRLLSVSGHRVLYFVDPDTGDRETAGNVTIVAVFGPGNP